MNMLKPILAFSLVLAGALSASGGDFEVKISDRYLNFPVSHRDGRCRMTLSAPGHEDYSFDIRIASDKPDYWVFLDMSGYKGKTVTVSYPEDRAGLASIYQDDEIAGTDSLYREYNRPQIHYTQKRGWNNDPNGLAWFGGKYHVFFQYCPQSAQGRGPKCWGHYESPDLVNWTFTGAPLQPGGPCDRGDAYSGSAAEENGTLWLYYTGNYKAPGQHDYILTGRDHNTLRVAFDGRACVGEKQLLLSNADYPEDCTLHVRDPKVWQGADGVWRMVLGARGRDNTGRVLLYHGPDGARWTLARVLAKPDFGYMWECPDCFELDGRWYLSASPQGLDHGETRYQNVYQSGYFPLAGDPETGELLDFYEWDMGFDFYAPQTFLAPDGRRLLIAWMGMPDADYHNPTAALGWQHCLTLPREVFPAPDGRLCQRPVRELETCRRQQVIHRNIPVSGEVNLPGIQGRMVDMTVTIRPTGDEVYRWFRIHVAKDGAHDTIIRYRPNESTLKIDRTRSGLPHDIVHTRSFLVRPRNGELKLRILLDRFSVEVFVNDGEQAASSVIYTRQEADAITFEAGGQALMDVEKYDLIV